MIADKHTYLTKGIVFGLVGLLFLTNLEAVPAETKEQKACKAYQTYLAENVSHYEAEEGDWYDTNDEDENTASEFMLADLNGDGVDELITCHPVGYKQDSLMIYRYKGGVKYIGTVDVTSTAGGWYDVYICKKNHLHVNYKYEMLGIKTYSTYRLKKNKLQLYAYKSLNKLEGTKEYCVKGKVVSSKKYKGVVEGCKKDHGMMTNTKSNRKKI